MPSPRKSRSLNLSLWRKIANVGASGFAVGSAILVLIRYSQSSYTC